MAISSAFCKEVQKPKKSPGSILTHLSKTYAGSVAFAAIYAVFVSEIVR